MKTGEVYWMALSPLDRANSHKNAKVLFFLTLLQKNIINQQHSNFSSFSFFFKYYKY
jgi:hypothetical protein